MPTFEPTKRRTRSKRDLEGDSKTLRYELENLVGIATEYSPSWRTTCLVRNNAYVEAFAVHCRALIFFLFGHLGSISAEGRTEGFSSVRDDDVIACDFHPAWKCVCPAPAGVLVDAKWRADKHVAHITVDRREVNQPGSEAESAWDLAGAASAICAAMDRFLGSAPADRFDAGAHVVLRDVVSRFPQAAPPAGVPAVPAPRRSAVRATLPRVRANTEAPCGPPGPGCDTHGRTG